MATTAERVVVELTADVASFNRALETAAKAAEEHERRISAAARRAADVQTTEAEKGAVGIERAEQRNVKAVESSARRLSQKTESFARSTLTAGVSESPSTTSGLSGGVGRVVLAGGGGADASLATVAKGVGKAGGLIGLAGEKIISDIVNKEFTYSSEEDRLIGRLSILHNNKNQLDSALEYVNNASDKLKIDEADFGNAYIEYANLIKNGVLTIEEGRDLLEGSASLAHNAGRDSDSVLQTASIFAEDADDQRITLDTIKRIGNLYGTDFSDKLNKALSDEEFSGSFQSTAGDRTIPLERAVQVLQQSLKTYSDPRQLQLELQRRQIDRNRADLERDAQSPDRDVALAATMDLLYQQPEVDLSDKLLANHRRQIEAVAERDLKTLYEAFGRVAQQPSSALTAGFLPPGIFQDQPPLFGLPVEPIGIGSTSVRSTGARPSASALVEDAQAGGLTPSLSADQEKYNALYQEGQVLTASLRTEQEILNATLARYGELLQAGAITQETYDRAVEKITGRQAQLNQAITAVGDVFVNGIKGAADFNDALDAIGLGLLDLAIKGLFGQGALGGVFNQLLGNESGAAGILGALIAPVTTSTGGGTGGGGGGLGSFLGSVLSGLFGGGLAAGGQALPGKLYQVGEAGREWFAPSVPGQVIPNSVIKNAAGGGGGSSQPIQFNISMAGANGDRAIYDIAARAVKTGLAGVPEINRQHEIRFA